MADFPILFTGKDVSYEPRSTGELERSRRRFNELYLQTEQQKLAQKLRDEEFYFKTADIDPVQLMSDRLTQLQEESISNFNNKWAAEMSKTGNLTRSQKSEMFRDRQMLEAQQTGVPIKISPVRMSGMTPYVTRIIE